MYEKVTTVTVFIDMYEKAATVTVSIEQTVSLGQGERAPDRQGLLFSQTYMHINDMAIFRQFVMVTLHVRITAFMTSCS